MMMNVYRYSSSLRICWLYSGDDTGEIPWPSFR